MRFPALFASLSIALAACGGEGGREPAAEGNPAGLSSPGPLHVTPDGPNDYWAGGNPVTVPVRFIAHYSDGSSAETRVQTELQPGWG